MISEYAAAMRGWTPGLLVAEINPDMPVAHSGLVVGDTIVEIEGESVLDDETDDVGYKIGTILAGKKPGDVVTVTVVRKDSLGRDREVDIDIELSEYVRSSD